jgi:hypothetical protein
VTGLSLHLDGGDEGPVGSKAVGQIGWHHQVSNLSPLHIRDILAAASSNGSRLFDGKGKKSTLSSRFFRMSPV